MLGLLISALFENYLLIVLIVLLVALAFVAKKLINALVDIKTEEERREHVKQLRENIRVKCAEYEGYDPAVHVEEIDFNEVANHFQSAKEQSNE